MHCKCDNNPVSMHNDPLCPWKPPVLTIDMAEMKVRVHKYGFWYIAKCTGYRNMHLIPPVTALSISKSLAVARARQRGYNRAISRLNRKLNGNHIK